MEAVGKQRIRKPGNILVFKTSVQTKKHIKQLRLLLDKEAGKRKWNFDLDDQDKIFRTRSMKVNVYSTIQLFKQAGFACEELKE
ncbi:MAG: hypothetical protein ACK5OS_06690 [Chryseotalea sp.]